MCTTTAILGCIYVHITNIKQNNLKIDNEFERKKARSNLWEYLEGGKGRGNAAIISSQNKRIIWKILFLIPNFSKILPFPYKLNFMSYLSLTLTPSLTPSLSLYLSLSLKTNKKIKNNFNNRVRWNQNKSEQNGWNAVGYYFKYVKACCSCLCCISLMM